MTIRELRILPPFAIGRLGSAPEPLDNYTIEDDRENPLGFRQIVGAPTLVVDETSGEIREQRVSKKVTFKQGDRIRPVAPFLEVFAVTGEDHLEPLDARPASPQRAEGDEHFMADPGRQPQGLPAHR